MTFSSRGLAWLTPIAPPSSETQPEQNPPEENERDSPASLPPKKRQRSHRAPVSLDEFLTGSFSNNGPCCKKLNCAASFASVSKTTHNAEQLNAEQGRFAALSTETDRKRFVSERAPYTPLVLGSMMAAGQPVCTKFFATIYGVSKGLIDAVKGNPGARASSKIGR